VSKGKKTMYTLKEAAEEINYSTKTLRRYIKEGRIDAFRIHRSYRISAAALERVIKRDMRRNFESDMGLIDSCYTSLWLLGINALSPLHRGFEAIKEAMRRGVNVKVLLLDPDSLAFKARADKEADGIPEYTVKRLKSEFETSMALCRCIADSVGTGDKYGKIEVSLHGQEPHCSMILIDYISGENVYWACNYNPYPKINSTRGISGRTFFVENAPEEKEKKTKKKTKESNKIIKIQVSEDQKNLKSLDAYKKEYTDLFNSATCVSVYEDVEQKS